MGYTSENSPRKWASIADSVVSLFGTERDKKEQSTEEAGPVSDSEKSEIDQVAGFLSSVDLDASPSNYALGWEYYYGTNFQLRTAIETTLDRVGRMTTEQAEELMAKHSSSMNPEGIQKMMKEGKDLISTGEKTLSKSRDDSAEYGVALQESLDSMDPDGPDWASRFEALLEVTNAMVDRTKKAEKKLKSASQRLNVMNEELQKAKESAELDQLTGLPNRRAFERHFNAAVERSNKQASNLSVAFVDIDHFKQVNDTHGHETGDRVLVEIAKQLNKMSNGKCHVARHGGEEFVILFEGKNAQESKDLIDMCREQTAERYMTNRETKKPIGAITFSAGVSSLNERTGSRELLRNSDIALYYAKHNGRNQAIIYDDIPSEEG